QRVRREDQHIAEARELFEASQDSDFLTLMRAYQFAKNCHFSVERCRRYAINAKVAREVEQTCQQILEIARREKLAGTGRSKPEDETDATASTENSKLKTQHSPDPLLWCIAAGFI